MQDRTLEHGIPVPQIVEEVPVDIVLSTPQERVQNLVGEQIVGVPVPPVMKDGFHLVPQERVLKCTPEQLVDVPVPQIMEATVENRVGEQIADSPCASVHGYTTSVCSQVEELIQEHILPHPKVTPPHFPIELERAQQLAKLLEDKARLEARQGWRCLRRRMTCPSLSKS